MNARQRVVSALRLQRPDRIPVAVHDFLVCARLLNRSFADVFRSGELIAASQRLGAQLFEPDMLLVETGVACLAESCGCAVEYPADKAPWVTTPIFKGRSPADIARALPDLALPDPAENAPMAVMVEAVHILAQDNPRELFIMGRADQGPFSLACELRGMDEFLFDLATGEAYIPDLLQYTSAVYRTYAQALLDAGADGTSMGESVAGPDVVSPTMFRKYAFEHERTVIAALNGRGHPVALHICGCADAILDDMIATGAGILEIDEKTDLGAALRKADGKTCLLGTLSPRIIQEASHDVICDRTSDMIAEIKGCYGFIVSSGCALPAETPLENIQCFVEAAKRCGVYDA